MEFIILDNDKHPTHKFKTKEDTKSFKEVKEFDNYAVVVPKGFIVLDFDTTDDAEIMLNIVDSLDIKTRVIQTKRGYHFWFKANEPWKNFIKQRLAIGLYADCKSGTNGDKRAYVILKKQGKTREVIRKCKLDDLDTVPNWLKLCDNPSEQFNFKGMGEGDGRNQELFNYIAYMQDKGFMKADIVDALNIINDYVFEDSLTDYEMKTLTRDESFKLDDEEVKKNNAAKVSGFNHQEFGDELIKQYHIITVNEQLYVYDDGYYQQDDRIVEKKMIELFPRIKQAQRTEVLAYIRIETHKREEDIKVNPYIVNLDNTRLDVRDGKLLPFDPKAIEFDRIPVRYDQKAKSKDVDKMLDKVFENDVEIRELFEEMLGYALIKHNRYRSGFMLVGSGHNGKSTILNMIKAFLGVRNYSSIELNKLTDRFATAELQHKLANIGDDINNAPLRDTGTIKKLFTGDSIMVERKGERPFELHSYATMIFSANEIPRSYDKTDGFYSRLVFIPFDASFSSDDEDFDPNIEDKITTDKALSYVLNLALAGAKRLIKRGSFIKPQRTIEVMDEYKTENSNVLSWVDDEDVDLKHVLSISTAELYSEFSDWAKQSGIKTNNITGKKGFNKEMRLKFELSKRPMQKSNGKRYWTAEI